MSCLRVVFGPRNIPDPLADTLLGKLFSAFILNNALAFSKKIWKALQVHHISPADDIVIYSYWMMDLALAALLVRQYGFPKSWVASRVHGYDLYSYRQIKGLHIPYQPYMMEQLNAVYPCSKDGERHLIQKYPEYAHKINCRYLGTAESGVNPSGSNGFHIVSCSSVSPLKRVELIGQAVALLMERHTSVYWTHFGDGGGLHELRKWSKTVLYPDNIRLAGNTPNKDVLTYYAKNHCDLFVNVSTSEGLPVSIMEAQSFGIPTLATNVGGTSEIVIDGLTGALLNAEINAGQLADSIERFVVMSACEIQALRVSSKLRWAEYFSADTNYEAFAKELAGSSQIETQKL
jgi:glycosyltransferase involved in cell wall biosynthesis